MALTCHSSQRCSGSSSQRENMHYCPSLAIRQSREYWVDGTLLPLLVEASRGWEGVDW